MFTVNGKLIDSKGNEYLGHYILVRFNQAFEIETDQGKETIWQPSKLRAIVSNDGLFVLVLPDKDKMQGEVIIDVISPDAEIRGTKSYRVSELTDRIDLNIDAKTFFEIEDLADPDQGKHIKLYGRAIDSTGQQQISSKQIVLWARPKGSEPDGFIAVLVADTDVKGYFSDDYPRELYEEAYGVVYVGENKRVPIRLMDDGSFPRRVILVVEVSEEIEEADRPGVPRAPDSQDLVNSPSTYSVDLAGRCVDFTVPNRTLEEFSFYSVVRTTEPEIKGLTLTEPKRIPVEVINSLASKFDPAAEIRSGPSSVETQPKVSYAISPQILSSLASDPDYFTPEKLMTAQRHTIFKDISNVIAVYKKDVSGRNPLNVENPVDWDDEPTFYQATTIAHGHILHFKQIWKADGYSMGDLLYSLPLAPCQKKQIAVIDWDRREAGMRTERLEEEEQLAAMISRDRDISEIVRSTLNENVRGGSEASTWAAGGGLGLALGPLVIGGGGGGGGASSSAWQDSARSLAASSLQQLRDRTMQSAQAVRNQRSTVIQTVRQGESLRVTTEVVANHNHCHAITVEYFEVLRHFQTMQELADVQECLFVPLLMSKFDFTKSLRWRESLGRFLRNRRLISGFDAMERIQNNYVGSDMPTGRYSQETIEYMDGELRISFQLSRPRDKADATIEEVNWLGYAPFLWLSPLAIFNQYFLGQIQAERDRIFQAVIAPRIAEAFVQSLKFYIVGSTGEFEVKLDPTLVSSYASKVPLYVSLRPAGSVPAVSREWVTRFKILTNYALPEYSKAIVHSGSVRYRTRYMSHFLFRDWSIANDLMPADPVMVPTYPDSQELRNPREEDKEISRKLLSHLNEHIEYYHKAIWWSMDPERRYMLLDGFVAPNANGKSVASVVENRLIGTVGNCLIMPVARGFHLDPTYKQKDVDHPVDLLNLYAPNTPIPPMRISVPTKGVFAEAVKGSCNSCEEKDDTRFWKFEESPCGDEPTAIQPVGTESRRTEPGNLKPSPFPTPMINLQNAPAAPDPTGLAAALSLIGTPNIFKDITGLTENQRNALEAFKASLDTARFFGGEASKLAQQQALTKDIDKTLGTIKKAQKDGLIDGDQASDLTQSVLKGMIGEERKEAKKLTDEPEVKKLIDAANDSDKADVFLSRPGEKIQVKRNMPEEGSEEVFDFDVPGIVSAVAQPTNMTCWAAVVTMMLSWREQASYTIEHAMDLAGPVYMLKFNKSKTNDKEGGLLGSEKAQLIAALDMVGEAPMSYTVNGLKDLLQTYGPLWVTTDENPTEGFSIHARLITGMFGDGSTNGTSLRIIDPAGGRRYTESFRVFARKFEEEAKDSKAKTLRIQMVHFRKPMDLDK